MRHMLRNLEMVIESGVQEFDTSPFYAYGLAETALGHLHHKSEIQINTKICLYPKNRYTINYRDLLFQKIKERVKNDRQLALQNFDFKIASKSVESSLSRLNTDCINILFVHEPIFSQINFENLATLSEKLKKSGKIRKLGLSGNVLEIEKCLNNQSNLIDIVQVPFRESDYLISRGIHVDHIFSVFLGSENIDSRLQEISEKLEQIGDLKILISTKSKRHLKQIIETTK